VVHYLHNNGAKLDARDNEPLCKACEGGHLDVVRYLHNNGARLIRYLHNDGVRLDARENEPLIRACAGGHLDIVRYLRENGVDLTAPDNEPMCRAAAEGQLEVVSYIHQDGGDLSARDNEALCCAAGVGHLELVRYILENGGNISARNSGALRGAAAGGHLEMVRYLHEAGAAASLLTEKGRGWIEQMRKELAAAPAVDQPSAFWKQLAAANERVLDWSGEANVKRTLNQNYFNFMPDDARMRRMRRLAGDLGREVLEQYVIEDPDCDPASWTSCYPAYFIFKEPDRTLKLKLYGEYLGRLYEYALQRDRSGLLATLEEPILGNPIRVRRDGRLISQDLVNSVRERNAIVAGLGRHGDAHFTLAELGAGYGRLGYVMLKTTQCRYFVFDIPPALYLSQWYLTTLFPERRAFEFRRFGAFEEIESELSGAEIAFFTPNQLAKFPPAYFDVFASISSVHEMRRDQISHYMTLMGRTAKSALYLKQQRDYVNPVDNLIIGKGDYPLPVGWSPKHERFDLINPGFFERVYKRDERPA
jgi:putative sugar O-methyltransferase